MNRYNFKTLLLKLNIDDKFLKQFMAAKNDDEHGWEKDRMLIQFGKDCKAKLNDIHTVVEATKFAINRYGESKYPKYEALNSLACAASVQCMTDMRENYKAGRISDAEWVKYGKGL